MTREYRVCTRCIMDTTDPAISFDRDGHCNNCNAYFERRRKELLPPGEREKHLDRLVNGIKADGAGKEYDCIIGVSGGVDSTMVAYQVKNLGLRPLAVHLDNGWDSELSVHNIRNTLDRLKIDLITYVIDWEEFRDLQLAFLRASVANCEIPTDHAITATLFREAHKARLRFIISGSNLATEGIMPISWGHYNQDLRQLKAVHRRFGKIKMRTMPTISIPDYLFYVFVKGMRQIPLLNYFDYNKEEAKKFLSQELGWRDYGGKHYESIWTRFFQGYYLPRKFGFDKRRPHLSTMVCAGTLPRQEALAEMENPPYPEQALQDDLTYVLKKFTLSPEEFQAILDAPARPHSDYPNHEFLFHKLLRFKNMFRRFATRA